MNNSWNLKLCLSIFSFSVSQHNKYHILYKQLILCLQVNSAEVCFGNVMDESVLCSLNPTPARNKATFHSRHNSAQSSDFSSARSIANAEASACIGGEILYANGGGSAVPSGLIGLGTSSGLFERTVGSSSWGDRFSNFSALMDKLVKGPLMMCHYARPHLMASRGAIINVASVDNIQAVRVVNTFSIN